ncbi:uncharacterized protein LOC121384779 [Gigantopelta aegis]|uniref:uncharacterized protein LOC121384779 n=1 Tax=Gigantopelta aegis TaxID=1735272 RepID=UPI001B88CE5D|nr:uncharacterized protein LOC121384779 [Gigantopelta aegis]
MIKNSFSKALEMAMHACSDVDCKAENIILTFVKESNGKIKRKPPWFWSSINRGYIRHKRLPTDKDASEETFHMSRPYITASPEFSSGDDFIPVSESTGDDLPFVPGVSGKDLTAASKLTENNFTPTSQWNDMSTTPELSADNITPAPEILGNYLRTTPEVSENYLTAGSDLPGNDFTPALRFSGNDVNAGKEINDNDITTDPKLFQNYFTSSSKLTHTPGLPDNVLTTVPESSENVSTPSPRLSGNSLTGAPELSGNGVTTAPKSSGHSGGRNMIRHRLLTLRFDLVVSARNANADEASAILSSVVQRTSRPLYNSSEEFPLHDFKILDMAVQCQAGFTHAKKYHGRCVACGVGTFHKKNQDLCMPCPKGKYQTIEGQTSCIACPPGTSTLGNGTKTLARCMDACKPHEYSSTGLQPCFRCPGGTIQPREGSTFCHLCPLGTINHKVTKEPMCIPREYCNQIQGGCDHICETIKGGSTCICKNDYILQADGFTCAKLTYKG